MEQLYDLASFFIERLSSVGDWLLNKPLEWAVPVLRVRWLEQGLPDFIVSFFDDIGNMSIASMIFGAGLIGILAYKFIKFLTDLFF